MKKNYLRSILLILFVGILLSVLTFVGVITFQVQKLNTHFTVFNHRTSSYELVSTQPKNWVRFDSISNVGRWAIIVSEDWAFYEHDGFDYNQIQEVIEESFEEGKFVRGASTITQQVAKNVFLNNERSLYRKILEAVYTFVIENRVEKNQILEHYLNLVELGKDLYGIKAASSFYFKKHPSKLTAKEGAFLAMLLPSPVRYSQSFNEGRLTDFASEQISKILVKLRQAKVITEEERVDAEAEYLPFTIYNQFDDDLFSIENESY